jgi:hypothetical protein
VGEFGNCKKQKITEKMTGAATTTTSGKKESALVKFAVSGGVTLVYEVCLGHFLEFLKGLKKTKKKVRPVC